jgi:hypothetical protein
VGLIHSGTINANVNPDVLITKIENVTFGKWCVQIAKL